MSLVGSLRDLPFADIIQILCLSRRSGTLTLENPPKMVQLHFEGGQLTGADLPGEESPLVRGIRRESLVPPQILEQAIRECRRANDSLLKNLAAKTFLDPRRVRELVVGEVRLLLRDLLGWENGEFRFDLAQKSTDLRAAGRRGPEQRGGGTPTGGGTQLRIPEGMDPREILLEEMTAMGAPTVQHFFLPTVVETEAPDLAGRRTENPPGIRREGEEEARWVVLVDERSVYRETLAREWRQSGLQVETFHTAGPGYQRFAALQEKANQVCLVADLVVPETGGPGYAGGLEVLVRARQEFPQSKVILMSEGIDPTVEEAAKSLGVRGILEKPTTLPADASELKRTVQRLAHNGLRLLLDEGETLQRISSEEDPAETIRVVDQLSLLGGLLGELHRPESELEIPLLVLRLASEYFERGVLLAIEPDEARGLGGFTGGSEGTALGGRSCGIRLARTGEGHVEEVVRGKTSVRATFLPPEERRMLEPLGGESAGEAVFLPLFSRNQVVAVLYGDNGQRTTPIGDTRGLEIFLGEVGSALERNLRKREGIAEAAEGS